MDDLEFYYYIFFYKPARELSLIHSVLFNELLYFLSQFVKKLSQIPQQRAGSHLVNCHLYVHASELRGIRNAVPTTVKRESYRSSPRKLTRPLPIPTMSIAVQRKLADKRKMKLGSLLFSPRVELFARLLINFVSCASSVSINVHFK